MIRLYTDGACIGNPGPGGWAAIIIDEASEVREIAGWDPQTTNNRMEILATLKGLEATPPGSNVTVYSDSRYVVHTMSRNWKRHKNQDLWARLDNAVAARRVRWGWVRGHAGNPGNELADALANKQARIAAGQLIAPLADAGSLVGHGSARLAGADEESTMKLFIGSHLDGRTNRGAWVALVKGPAKEQVLWGVEEGVTDAHLQILALERALGVVRDAATVEIRSSLEYLIKCGSGEWRRHTHKDAWVAADRALGSKRVVWLVDDTHTGQAVAHAARQLHRTGLLPEVVGSGVAETGHMHGDGGARSRLTHLDESGRARMVDIGDKPVTDRTAVARATVTMQSETLALAMEGRLGKGDVVTVARLAGIGGAKRTADLVPLAHSVPLSHVDMAFEADIAQGTLDITATVRAEARTGVELEALAAVSLAALAVYDMCKAAERGIVIRAVQLVEKRGGQRGDWSRDLR